MLVLSRLGFHRPFRYSDNDELFKLRRERAFGGRDPLSREIKVLLTRHGSSAIPITSGNSIIPRNPGEEEGRKREKEEGIRVGGLSSR